MKSIDENAENETENEIVDTVVPWGQGRGGDTREAYYILLSHIRNRQARGWSAYSNGRQTWQLRLELVAQPWSHAQCAQALRTGEISVMWRGTVPRAAGEPIAAPLRESRVREVRIDGAKGAHSLEPIHREPGVLRLDLPSGARRAGRDRREDGTEARPAARLSCRVSIRPCQRRPGQRGPEAGRDRRQAETWRLPRGRAATRRLQRGGAPAPKRWLRSSLQGRVRASPKPPRASAWRARRARRTLLEKFRYRTFP